MTAHRSTQSARGLILIDAHALVGGEREDQYGAPLDCHTSIAEMWAAWLRRKPGLESIKLTAEDVCWMQVLVKAAREAHAHKRDNLIDAIGYLENAEECRLERTRREERERRNTKEEAR